MVISSNAQLEAILLNALKGAIDYCAEKAKTALQDCIDNRGIGSGGSFYRPTGEFREAWETTKAQIVGKGVVADLHYEPSGMGWYPTLEKTYAHGTPPDNDARESLAEIIFQGLSGNALNLGVYQGIPRDAWEDLKHILDNELDSWFAEGMMKQGFYSSSGAFSVSAN